jgi:dTMP kinase
VVLEHSGKFIVIEGIDGSGTTTQSQLLTNWVQSRGRRAVMTSEPSQGPIGAMLRQILSGRLVAKRLDGTQGVPDNDVIALLFAADRLDHLDNEILPLLQSGADVICDRYYHSSITYQSLRGDREWIRMLNAHARPPDVTYLIDIPAEEAERRRSQRTQQEIYETLETQRLLEQAYREIPNLFADQAIVVVDGSSQKDLVHRSITDELIKRFGWE